jgi:hypothetical protein
MKLLRATEATGAGFAKGDNTSLQAPACQRRLHEDGPAIAVVPAALAAPRYPLRAGEVEQHQAAWAQGTGGAPQNPVE